MSASQSESRASAAGRSRPSRRTTPESLREDLAKAFAGDGPHVVVLPAVLRMFAPTHLEHT